MQRRVHRLFSPSRFPFYIRHGTSPIYVVHCWQRLCVFTKAAGGVEEQCSEAFIGRRTATTAGIEDLFLPGGITIGHMLLINAEGPSDGADRMAHFTVSSAVGFVDSVCAVVKEFVRDGFII